MGERLHGMQEVMGSSPFTSIRFYQAIRWQNVIWSVSRALFFKIQNGQTVQKEVKAVMKTRSYRRHSSGQARVTIQGKTYYLGLFNSKASKREYDRLIAEYLASGRSTTFGQPSEELTVSELMADYLRFAKSNYGPSEMGVIKVCHETVAEYLWSNTCQRLLAATVQGNPRASCCYQRPIFITRSKMGRGVFILWLRPLRWIFGFIPK